METGHQTRAQTAAAHTCSIEHMFACVRVRAATARLAPSFYRFEQFLRSIIGRVVYSNIYIVFIVRVCSFTHEIVSGRRVHTFSSISIHLHWAFIHMKLWLSRHRARARARCAHTLITCNHCVYYNPWRMRYCIQRVPVYCVRSSTHACSQWRHALVAVDLCSCRRARALRSTAAGRLRSAQIDSICLRLAQAHRPHVLTSDSPTPTPPNDSWPVTDGACSPAAVSARTIDN